MSTERNAAVQAATQWDWNKPATRWQWFWEDDEGGTVYIERGGVRIVEGLTPAQAGEIIAAVDSLMSGEPCIVCGASILNGRGHDAGCMVAP